MRTIALLIALLILVIFGYDIIFSNFANFAFHWSDLLYYAIAAAVIYIIVRLVGGSLNKTFEKSVNYFLQGKSDELIVKKSLLRVYGLLLITLFPFLLYLFAVGLFAAIDFGLYGVIGIFQLPRIPIAVPIGLGIVVLGTGLAVLIGIYYLFFPPKRKPFGIALNENEEKKLWKLTQDIAKEIESKPIGKIIVTPEPGIGVYLEGNLLSKIFGGGTRVLEIGLPSLHKLSIDEFKAILAHEYGHFSNKDTQWTPFTYAMGSSLTNTLRSMPGPSSNENEEGGIVRGIMSLNPAYWLLLLYVHLYFRITNAFSRIGEVKADIRAMQLYGGKAFRNGLLKVSTNDTIFSEIIQAKHIPELLKEGKTISNFSKFTELILSDVDKKTIDKIQAGILEMSQSHSIYDSHPALKIRIDYSEKFDNKEEKEKDFVDKLFDNWDKINEKVAELYNLRILTYLQALQQQSGAEEETKKE